MKIYTRTGDGGETSLFGGGRVPKDHARVVAYGTVDELNAFLGRAIGSVRVASCGSRLATLQHDLFTLGAHLATPPRHDGGKGPKLPALPKGRVAEMEEWIDEAEAQLRPLDAFILPGGSHGAIELHVCRTVCRRAERALVPLMTEGDTAVGLAVQYLNRLSDLLFVMARLENLASRTPEVEWTKGKES